MTTQRAILTFHAVSHGQIAWALVSNKHFFFFLVNVLFDRQRRKKNRITLQVYNNPPFSFLSFFSPKLRTCGSCIFIYLLRIIYKALGPCKERHNFFLFYTDVMMWLDENRTVQYLQTIIHFYWSKPYVKIIKWKYSWYPKLPNDKLDTIGLSKPHYIFRLNVRMIVFYLMTLSNIYLCLFRN